MSLIKLRNNASKLISNKIGSKIDINSTGTPTPPVLFTIATGGVITTDGNYKIHSLVNGDVFDVTQLGTDPNCEVLIVAGGGAGGCLYWGGGGGAGGVLQIPAWILSLTSYTIIVGAGGTILASSPTSGGNSSFDGNIAFGGGYGADYNLGTVGSGGSGGGGGSRVGVPEGSVVGTGTVPQGFDGGIGIPSPGLGRAGGGGGGGSIGGNAFALGAGNGGVGILTTIRGTNEYFGGGGGGGAENGGLTAGLGGLGGGGSGGVLSAGNNGVDGFGGGGGGDGNNGATNGGLGGSGIVIIRYKFQ